MMWMDDLNRRSRSFSLNKTKGLIKGYLSVPHSEPHHFKCPKKTLEAFKEEKSAVSAMKAEYPWHFQTLSAMNLHKGHQSAIHVIGIISANDYLVLQQVHAAHNF